MYAHGVAGHAGETLVYVAGRKGQGKSTFMRATVIADCQRGYRHVAWDTTREWARAVAKLPADVARAVARFLVVLPATHYTAEEAAQVAIDGAPAILVVDEIDRVAPNHAGGMVAGTNLHAIVNYGRHLNAGLFCASRRPARVHSEIPSLADRVVLFQLTAPRDLAWVEDLGGPELARDVRALSRGDYVVWSPSDDEPGEEAAPPEAAPRDKVPASSGAVA